MCVISLAILSFVFRINRNNLNRTVRKCKMLNQVHFVAWGNLSGWALIYRPGEPPALKNVSWSRRRVLYCSNRDSRCCAIPSCKSLLQRAISTRVASRPCSGIRRCSVQPIHYRLVIESIVPVWNRVNNLYTCKSRRLLAASQIYIWLESKLVQRQYISNICKSMFCFVMNK